jgi:hypothetical protein
MDNSLGIEWILGVGGMDSVVFDCFVKARIWNRAHFVLCVPILHVLYAV